MLALIMAAVLGTGCESCETRQLFYQVDLPPMEVVVQVQRPVVNYRLEWLGQSSTSGIEPRVIDPIQRRWRFGGGDMSGTDHQKVVQLGAININRDREDEDDQIRPQRRRLLGRRR